VDRRMVAPPTPTHRMRSDYFAALLEVAQRLADRCPPEYAQLPLHVLVTWPDMFSSEVCLFVDPEYHREFFEMRGRADSHDRLDPLEQGRGLARRLGVEIPAGMREAGYTRSIRRDDEGGFHEEWWVYSIDRTGITSSSDS